MENAAPVLPESASQQPKPFEQQTVRLDLLLKAEEQKNRIARSEPNIPSVTEPKAPAKRIKKAAPAKAADTAKKPQGK